MNGPTRVVSILALATVGLALANGCAEDPSELRPGARLRGAGETESTRPGDTEEGSTGTSSGTAEPGSPPGTPAGGGSSGTPAPAACKPGLTTVPLDLSPGANGPVRAAPTADGGTLVAWSGGGKINVRRLDGAGTKVGADRSVNGATVHGIAAMPDGVALLVARAPDVLALVKIADAGTVTFDKPLLGNVDHATVGSEWFEFQPQFFQEAGRLVWTGTQLVSYVPIFRRWPDGIAHTGDQLRRFDASGNPAQGGGWGWGCSHSLDVRLTADGEKQVCLSDCFPQKAILLGKSTVISAEPSGNCSGSSDTRLGGLVTAGGAAWLTFASREGRTSRDVALVKVGDPTKRWLTQATDASAPHLAAFGTGMLAGWRVGNTSTIQRLDAQGNAVGTPENVSTTPFGEGDDFLAWPGGDAGWIAETNGGLKLARVGACD